MNLPKVFENALLITRLGGREYRAVATEGIWADCADSADLRSHLRFSPKLAQNIIHRHQPWFVLCQEDAISRIIAYCTLARGKWNSSLFVSLPVAASMDQVSTEWLLPFADKLQVTGLTAEQFTSQPTMATFPASPFEDARYSNVKLFIWDLRGDDWDKKMGSNHRRNLSRARKTGLKIKTSTDDVAILTHLELTGVSLDRRAQRGESTALATGHREIRDILASGQAELFQALEGDVVVSSKIVYSVDKYSFYYSGGTSEQGRKLGASHFLMHWLASTLRDRGMVSLNLDVASEGTGGLSRYKAEFGTDEFYVSRANYNFSGFSRKVSNVFRNISARLIG